MTLSWVKCPYRRQGLHSRTMLYTKLIVAPNTFMLCKWSTPKQLPSEKHILVSLSCTWVPKYNAIPNFKQKFVFWVQNAQQLKIPCARSPGCLTFLLWQLTYSVQLLQVSSLQTNVSVHMHQAESTRQVWGSQVTQELWLLSAELASCHFLAPRIWRWLSDFWKNCGHILLHFAAHFYGQFSVSSPNT